MTSTGTIAPVSRTAGKQSIGRASAAFAVVVTGAEIPVRPEPVRPAAATRPAACSTYGPAMAYRFRTEVWLHQGDAAWHFLTVPADVSDDIEARTSHLSRGFGSVRVRVTVGATTWATSVFPDTKRGAYVLPVKKEVRRAEGIDDGTAVDVALELVDV